MCDCNKKVVKNSELSAFDEVNKPKHYTEGRLYEPANVIIDWNLSWCLGNSVKYISRAGRKDKNKTIQDLQKAIWYLNKEIKRLTDEGNS